MGCFPSSIYEAASRGSIKELQYFIFSQHEDINSRDLESGSTPLHLAIYFEKYGNVQFLIEHGADLYAKDNQGYTPLHVSVVTNKSEYVLLLISIDNNLIYEKNIKGETPIHLAAEKNITILKILADYGVNEKDDQGCTPLHHAALNGCIENVIYLISKGSNVNEKNNRGWTPLHLAVRSGNINCAKELINFDANIFEKDNYGWSTLDLCPCESMRRFIRDEIDKKNNSVNYAKS